MSIFDHSPIKDEGDVCGYCLDSWPCLMGRARIEVAEAIRTMPDTVCGDYAYNSGADDGRDAAADMVQGKS